MKKSSFIALVMGTVSGVLFSLGMCMALLPEWNSFKEGIIFGGIGLVLGLITIFVWRKMENKKMPKMSVKNILKVVYIVLSALVFGAGLCLCIAFGKMVVGIIIGLIGVVMLLMLIPMFKGIK